MDFSIDSVINRTLLFHPMNWLIVWTVLIFWAVAAHIVMGSRNAPTSTDRKTA